jgi:hypothetical protein
MLIATATLVTLVAISMAAPKAVKVKARASK